MYLPDHTETISIVVLHKSARANNLVDFIETQILQGLSKFSIDLRGFSEKF